MHRVWIPLALVVSLLALAAGGALRAGDDPQPTQPLVGATPTCPGQWVGFEETFNGTDQEGDLEKECAPAGFTRMGPADRFADCEQFLQRY